MNPELAHRMEQGRQKQRIVCLLADSFFGMSALKKKDKANSKFIIE